MEPDTISYPLDYSRDIYQKALNWYASAETKAHIVLTLNGLMVGFLGGNLFLDKDKYESISNQNLWTLVFIILMLVCLTGSILFALLCLKSRFNKIDLAVYEVRDSKGKLLKYKNELIYFFDSLRQLKPEVLARQLQDVRQEDEIETLAYGIVELAKNVKAKHRSVNISFLLFGLSLISFMLALAVFLFNV